MRAVRSILFALCFYGATVGFVLVALVLMHGPRGPFMTVVAAWSRYFRWLTRHVLGLSDRIEGTFPPGPALYAIKHESFYETLTIATLLDLPAVVAKRELTAIPLWGRAARRYGILPVDRAGGAAALRELMRLSASAVADGRALVIFPEGTRVLHGNAPPLQAGFAALYKLLDLPVVPVAVNSGPHFRRFWKVPGPIHWRIGEVIPPGLPRQMVERRVHAAINALNPHMPGSGMGAAEIGG